jgi:hypothetical protein
MNLCHALVGLDDHNINLVIKADATPVGATIQPQGSMIISQCRKPRLHAAGSAPAAAR